MQYTKYSYILVLLGMHNALFKHQMFCYKILTLFILHWEISLSGSDQAASLVLLWGETGVIPSNMGNFFLKETTGCPVLNTRQPCDMKPTCQPLHYAVPHVDTVTVTPLYMNSSNKSSDKK